MTPNQAEELHDIIRESGIADEEQKRLHSIVDRDIDSAARKGFAYVKIYSDGTSPGSSVAVVDRAGRAHELDVGRVEINMCARDGVSATLHFPRQNVELDLNLETNDVVLKKLAEEIHIPGMSDDLDGDDLAMPDDVCAVPKPPGWYCTRGPHPTGTPCAAVPAPQMDRPLVAHKPGPHAHTYINGVCPGCGRRE